MIQGNVRGVLGRLADQVAQVVRGREIIAPASAFVAARPREGPLGRFRVAADWRVLMRPVKIEQEHGKRHPLSDVEVLTLLMPSPHNRASLKRLDLTIDSYTRWLTGLFGSLIDGM